MFPRWPAVALGGWLKPSIHQVFISSSGGRGNDGAPGDNGFPGGPGYPGAKGTPGEGGRPGIMGERDLT